MDITGITIFITGVTAYAIGIYTLYSQATLENLEKINQLLGGM